jgi:hypothetical protein
MAFKKGDKPIAPFEPGNQFWRQRSKHGRDTLFATPTLLMEAAQEYFQWVDEHPWFKPEAIKSGKKTGTMVNVPTARPYTISGFLLYVGASEPYWREFKKAGHDDFSTVIGIIDQTIWTQKFEGASVGAFNANIISRDLGLADKIDHTSKGESITPVIKIGYGSKDADL